MLIGYFMTSSNSTSITQHPAINYQDKVKCKFVSKEKKKTQEDKEDRMRNSKRNKPVVKQHNGSNKQKI